MLLITYVRNNTLSGKKMNLRSTILGILSWKPCYGYDLKRIISDSDIFYWSGNNNQIYKSLLELQNEGLVTCQVQLQEHLPAKKIYSITEQGLSELRKSLLAAPELPELHKDFLIQLAWAESLSDEEILNLLENYEEEVASRLRMYQAQAARSDNRPERSKREKYLWQRIAENLVNSFQAELDWVRQTRQELLEKKFLD
jgi:PadR family transcriptional regulator, regulatory protein AphA